MKFFEGNVTATEIGHFIEHRLKPMLSRNHFAILDNAKNQNNESVRTVGYLMTHLKVFIVFCHHILLGMLRLKKLLILSNNGFELMRPIIPKVSYNF